jgi:hypothetical protein
MSYSNSKALMEILLICLFSLTLSPSNSMYSFSSRISMLTNLTFLYYLLNFLWLMHHHTTDPLSVLTESKSQHGNRKDEKNRYSDSVMTCKQMQFLKIISFQRIDFGSLSITKCSVTSTFMPV